MVLHRMAQERRGRRRRRDRRVPKKPGLFARLLCILVSHDSVTLGWRHKFRVKCRRCQRYV